MAAAKIVPAQIQGNAPYLDPSGITKEVAWAIKAFNAGQANAAEQGLVWRVVIGILSAVPSLPYFPDTHDTAFINGRRYVGHHLIRIAQMSDAQISLLRKYSPGTPGGEDDEMPTI